MSDSEGSRASGWVDMKQDNVTLQEGGQDAKEGIVQKFSRSGHLGQIFSRRHIIDEVLQCVLSKKIPHLFQNHLPGKSVVFIVTKKIYENQQHQQS